MTNLRLYRDRVNKTLTHAIQRLDTPALLKEAMLYSTQNGGKRLRPLLVYSSAALFHLPPEKCDALAAAIECVHAYSLIHDDLPAMDDDTLRRGKPTCHLVFGEAIAILAGDALQTLAFQLITESDFDPHTLLKMVKLLSITSGSEGMIAGQVLDILGEHQNHSAADIQKMHSLKTGQLIRASVLLGAYAANACDADCKKLNQFALKLGIAFQLQDDLQDLLGDPKVLGKNTQQDSKLGKSSFAIIEGVAKTQRCITEAMAEAMEIIALFENNAQLKMVCDRMIL